MGFFSNSQLEDAIEKATSSVNVEVNWKMITAICDTLLANPKDCDEAMRAMAKHLAGKNAAVQLHTIKLLTTASNSVPEFRRSVASRELMGAAKKLLDLKARTNPTVAKELKEALVNWMMAFQGDASLSLVQMTVTELQAAGVLFTEDLHTAAKPARSGPSAEQLAAEREEEELAMALSASMADVQPAAPAGGGGGGGGAPVGEPPKAKGIMGKALYNFDASESNELSFAAGQRIMVFDRSDPNWWSGRTESGAEGYFPHNFITFDLDQAVATAEQGSAAAQPGPSAGTIDEETIDRTLDMIYDATQEGIRAQSTDIAEIKRLEAQCDAMVPVIDAKLGAIEAGEQELAALSDRYARAMALYEQMMAARAGAEAGIAQRQALRPGAAATAAAAGQVMYQQLAGATAVAMGQNQSPFPAVAYGSPAVGLHSAAHASPALPYTGAPVYVQSPATPAAPSAAQAAPVRPSPLLTAVPPAGLDPALLPSPAPSGAQGTPAMKPSQVPNLADLLTAAGAASFASPVSAAAPPAPAPAPAPSAGFVSPGTFAEL